MPFRIQLDIVLIRVPVEKNCYRGTLANTGGICYCTLGISSKAVRVLFYVYLRYCLLADMVRNGGYTHLPHILVVLN